MGQLRWSAGLLDATCPDQLRPELFSAVGDLAHRAGFMAFDGGADEDARRVLSFALACGDCLDPASHQRGDVDPEGPGLVTLRHAFQYLNRVLPARGFPQPHRRASEWIDDLVLAPNPASRVPKDTPLEQGTAAPAGDVCPLPGVGGFSG